MHNKNKYKHMTKKKVSAKTNMIFDRNDPQFEPPISINQTNSKIKKQTILLQTELKRCQSDLQQIQNCQSQHKINLKKQKSQPQKKQEKFKRCNSISQISQKSTVLEVNITHQQFHSSEFQLKQEDELNQRAINVFKQETQLQEIKEAQQNLKPQQVKIQLKIQTQKQSSHNINYSIGDQKVNSKIWSSDSLQKFQQSLENINQMKFEEMVQKIKSQKQQLHQFFDSVNSKEMNEQKQLKQKQNKFASFHSEVKNSSNESKSNSSNSMKKDKKNEQFLQSQEFRQLQKLQSQSVIQLSKNITWHLEIEIKQEKQQNKNK